MTATFDYVVLYEVTAECQTPLRSGGAGGEPESVLCGRDGRPFLQGSSLCGALRAWLMQQNLARVNALFGTRETAGKLVVSDGVFDDGASVCIRPRLRIDGATASAERGKKFDVASVARGGRFTFMLTLFGNGAAAKVEETSQDAEAVHAMLTALHVGLIRIGAQKSNAFGRVTLSVRQRVFDLTNESDREAWLADATDGYVQMKLGAARADEGAALFEIKAWTDAILVKSSAPVYLEKTSADAKEKSIISNYAENGTPILPSSSIKGAVRARAESIAEYLGVPELIAPAFGCEAGQDDNGVPGQVVFEDVLLDRDPRQRKHISRIRINRLTAGVISGGLFSEEPVRSDVSFRVSAPGDQPAACALMLYALRDLGLGLYNLGSGWAVGRGHIEVERIEIMQGTQRAALIFSSDRSCAMEDPDGLAGGWLRELEGFKHEN